MSIEAIFLKGIELFMLLCLVLASLFAKKKKKLAGEHLFASKRFFKKKGGEKERSNEFPERAEINRKWGRNWIARSRV